MGKEAGMELRWGKVLMKRCIEMYRCTGKTVVEVDPKYFPSMRSGTLLGDPDKGKEQRTQLEIRRTKVP